VVGDQVRRTRLVRRAQRGCHCRSVWEGQQRVSTTRANRRPGQAGRGRQRRPRPLPPGDTLFTPDPSPARASFEQRSATPLLWLHQLPRWLLPVLGVGLLVIGFALTGWGGGIPPLLLGAFLPRLALASRAPPAA